MNRIIINGVTIDVTGNNVSIKNGTVLVNGNTIKTGLSGIVQIKFEGELASLETDGNVECGNVQGDVRCGGSFQGGDVRGSVDCGGSFTGKNVNGNIDAGGSVKIIK